METEAWIPEEVPETAGPPCTADGQQAWEVAVWALPPEETLLCWEARLILRQATARWPKRYRTVYELAEIEGLAHQGTAAALERTVATVKSRLHRARLFVREALADYCAERRHTSA